MSTENTSFDDDLKSEFLDEAQFMLDDCEQAFLNLENSDSPHEDLQKIFRVAHSFKGAGAAVGFTDLSNFAHLVEDLLSLLKVYSHTIDGHVISVLLRSGDAFKVRIKSLRENSNDHWPIEELQQQIKSIINDLKVHGAVTSSQPEGAPPVQEHKQNKNSKKENDKPSADANLKAVKISTDRVENILNLVGELVVIKSQLIDQVNTHPEDARLNNVTGILDKTIRELQGEAIYMRMTTLKNIFLKTQRAIRDLSVKQAKAVDFLTNGEKTEIDRTMVDLLADPILHLARNSLDHGIESAEVRQSRGKSAKGTITLSAAQVGNRVQIRIQDDGGGINKERVLAKAIEKGLVAKEAAASMTEKDIFNLIFLPGFSTAEKVTDISGRGVGMDVVKTNIQKLNGFIDIESSPGQGTEFLLSLPLTTSISDGMIILAHKKKYLLPMESVVELIQLKDLLGERLDATRAMVRVRDVAMPLINIGRVLSESSNYNKQNQPEPTIALIVQTGTRKVAFQIDEVLGQTQFVQKPLDERFSMVKGVCGAAILGSGSVILVLDPQEVIKIHSAQLKPQTNKSSEATA